MDYNRIKSLLEKYFEATASITEEKELRDFFNNEKDIPSELEYAKVLFTHIKQEKSHTFNKPIQYEKSKKQIIYYLSTIAASILIVLGLFFANQESENKIIYAYVNGKAITDKNIAAEYSINALKAVSENLENGTKNLNYLNQFNKVEKLIKSK